uniref:Endonuclease/exonuclease/phosphatase n=1 Tax=Cyanothece sp. (strain PCC 7425 / ATCC 29141) TaxID=395961 RepID=B8HKT6_CYAP4
MNSQTLRIATWNLDHPKPGSWQKTPAILQQIEAINADVWILTETNNKAVDLAAKGYEKFTSIEYTDKGLEQNAYTTIWSRLQAPTQIIKTFDPDLSVCIKVSQPIDLMIYGTIITWHGDRGSDGTSKSWEEHYRSIQHHGDDWSRLIQEYSDHKLLVAGDFNQARDGSRWYGTQKGIDLLTAQLDRNHLVCLTDQIQPTNRGNVDHVCISQDLQPFCTASFWNNISDQGVKLSDHNGVFIDLSF